MMLAMEAVAVLLAVCALTQAALFAWHLRAYRTPRFGQVSGTRVTVAIPTRDEENYIRACLESVLRTEDIALDVIVGDGDSADRTARLVQEMSFSDPRVSLLRVGPAPSGWNAKLYACQQMAEASDAEFVLFLNADVQLDPWALARCIAAMKSSDAKLLSGFPKLKAVTWAEKTLLPLVQFELLVFLPLRRMRRTTKPKYAAGCGQFVLVERAAYFASGGHEAVRASRHEGLALARRFRECELRTTIVDLTRLAEVRMYRNARAVWKGLAKNATEGMAAKGRIVPLSIALILGQMLPPIAFLVWLAMLPRVAVLAGGPDLESFATLAIVTLTLAVAALVTVLTRVFAAARFRQSMGAAWLHPFGVLLLLTVQWWAWLCAKLGRPADARSRVYSHEVGEELV